jgi:hypothetical protein
MTPLKQLFDFSRVRDVPAGGSSVAEFEVSAAALAEVYMRERLLCDAILRYKRSFNQDRLGTNIGRCDYKGRFLQVDEKTGDLARRGGGLHSDV